MPPLNILVFLGSTRDGRFGERVSQYVMSQLKNKGHNAELIDPLKLGSDGHVYQPLQFRRPPAKIPQWMVSTNKKIVSADAYVIVTPEYNSTLPPALTASMDQFPPSSYRYKPGAIVNYSMGPFGGIRAALTARSFLSELGILSVPSAAVIPQVNEKFTAEGECTCDRAKKNISKVIDEVAWFANAILTKKTQDGLPSGVDLTSA